MKDKKYKKGYRILVEFEIRDKESAKDFIEYSRVLDPHISGVYYSEVYYD